MRDEAATAASCILHDDSRAGCTGKPCQGPTLPLPIAGLLTSASSVTLQLRGDDAPQCFGVTLSDIKKQGTYCFKAK